MRARMRAVVAGIVFSLAVGTAAGAFAAPPTWPGFLVIVPDRGYLGNEEIRAIWEDFRKGHRIADTAVAVFYHGQAPDAVRDHDNQLAEKTILEDWPDQRERAVADVRRMIEDAQRDGGRALVISNRIAGAGPDRRVLAGLDYVLNDQGIAPHPNLTRWIEEQIEAWIKTQLAAADPGWARQK